MRGLMIWAGVKLINRFEWLLYGFGAFLVFTGIKMLVRRGGGEGPEKSLVVRVARKILPVSNDFDGQNFTTRINGRTFFTPLFLVLLAVETTDLIFAVDSIPAIFGVTRKSFIVFTSNVFAILGLRSLYFVLAGAIGLFRYLKVGLSVVLVFIGVKMLIDPHESLSPKWFQYDMPDLGALLVVVMIIALSILASMIASKLEEHGENAPGKPGSPMKYRWLLATPQPLLAGQLAAALKISPLLAQCLLNRGFSEPAEIGNFLEPRLKQLADPFLLPDMATAVERLFRARERNEPLVIFGDYDVDGVTSTALLAETLRALGWQVNFYLPHRMEEGYGLSQDGVENCLKKFPATLLLAVDCGSTAVEAIDWLRQKGVDVLVLDHHQVSTPRARRGGAGQSANPNRTRTRAVVQGTVFGGTGVQARARAGEARARTRPAGGGKIRHPDAARSGGAGDDCRSRAADRRKPHSGFGGPGAIGRHAAARAGGVEESGGSADAAGSLRSGFSTRAAVERGGAAGKCRRGPAAVDGAGHGDGGADGAESGPAQSRAAKNRARHGGGSRSAR